MTCEECQGQLIAGGSGPAEEHLSACPECQAFVRDSEWLRGLARQAAEAECAPQTLRARVEALLEGVPAAVSRRRLRFAAVAAAVLLALGILGFARFYRQRDPSPNRLAEEFIEDHLNYLPGREQIVSASRREVEKWFEGKTDFPVRIPDIPSAALEDGRVCDISGRKAALLHYRRKPDDTLVSLFITVAPKSLQGASRPTPLQASLKGCNGTLWTDRGLVYGVVAPLDEASLKQFAEAVRRQGR